MTTHQRLQRRFTSSARPRRRNRAARHAGPLTVEWDARGVFRFAATADPSTVRAELTEPADPGGFIVWGPAHFWLPARPARPWVQRFPHRRGHGSRPGSSRRRRGR